MSSSGENGFDAVERQHREAFAELSPRQKLDWLQHAKEFCRKYLGAARQVASKTKAPK
jgi:hypothetical protein